MCAVIVSSTPRLSPGRGNERINPKGGSNFTVVDRQNSSRACFRPRSDLALENLALRRQLQVLNRRRPKPRTTPPDRFFWVTLRRFWSGWKQAPIIVEPETVVRRHRAGFKLYRKWLWRKHSAVGRKPTSRELRNLIDARFCAQTEF